MAYLLATVVLVGGCTSDQRSTVRLDELTFEPSANLEVLAVRGGLDGPTQLTIDPASGRWLIAELAGAENDGSGRIRSLSPEDANDTVVLLEDLDKPTGVTVTGDSLWVMERDRLGVAALADDRRSADALAVVLDELPFNGRSQGTLRVDGGGNVWFNTSGRLVDGEVVAGSGEIRTIDAPGRQSVEATGFKHAYATVELADGRIVSVEIADGRADGAVPPDEVVIVERGADHGWPDCVGDNQPVAERGASTSTCDATPDSLAVFEAGATPTSIIVAPWDDTELLVTLWVTGELVSVSLDDGAVTTLISGLSGPQHLAVDDGDVLLVEHRRNRVLRLAPVG